MTIRNVFTVLFFLVVAGFIFIKSFGEVVVVNEETYDGVFQIFESPPGILKMSGNYLLCLDSKEFVKITTESTSKILKESSQTNNPAGGRVEVVWVQWKSNNAEFAKYLLKNNGAPYVREIKMIGIPKIEPFF